MIFGRRVLVLSHLKGQLVPWMTHGMARFGSDSSALAQGTHICRINACLRCKLSDRSIEMSIDAVIWQVIDAVIWQDPLKENEGTTRIIQRGLTRHPTYHLLENVLVVSPVRLCTCCVTWPSSRSSFFSLNSRITSCRWNFLRPLHVQQYGDQAWGVVLANEFNTSWPIASACLTKFEQREKSA